MYEFQHRLNWFVRHRPKQTAVDDGRTTLSYGQLDHASGVLAARLKRTFPGTSLTLGFFGGATVHRALCHQAVIKCGGAMVHIDHLTPQHAFKEMNSVCRLDGVLTTPEMQALAAETCGGAPYVVELSTLLSGTEVMQAVDVDPDALIGLLYTSGSTGRPKCVPLTYGAVDVRLGGRDSLKLADEQHGHKVSFFNYWRVVPELEALQVGAQLTYFDLRHLGAVQCDAWLRANGITWLNCQTAIYRQIVRAAKAPFTDVRRVELVGDLIQRSDLKDFDRLFAKDAEFCSRFSATEHGDITSFFHKRGQTLEGRIAPLGRPRSPQSIRVLTEESRDAEPGEPGELIVSGPFLAADYLGDPERSKQAYFKDGDREDRRSFRTGFLAYQDREGVLHPLGRKDDTVKIRGFTLQLSEVEHLLQTHSEIDTAVAQVFRGDNGVDRLVAYVLTTGDPVPSVKALRRFVRDTAADYYAPSIVIQVDRFPYGPTGKIIRSGLPDPREHLSRSSKPDHADMTPEEAAITQIFRSVLGVQSVRPEDDFFDLGGDSLQITDVLLQIEKQFEERLSLESFILDGASAQAIAARLRRKDDAGPVWLQHGGSKPPIFATHQRGGHLSDYLPMMSALSPEQPVLGSTPRRLSVARATMREIASDSLEVLTSLQPEGPYRIMGFSYGGYIAAEMTRQLTEAGEVVSHLVLLEVLAPWKDPLRHVKSVLRPIKRGTLSVAMTQMTKWTPMLVGLRAPSTKIEDAHHLARLRFTPKPFGAENILFVEASKTPKRTEATAAWSRLMSGNVSYISLDTDHLGLLRPPLSWTVGQHVQDFLNK